MMKIELSTYKHIGMIVIIGIVIAITILMLIIPLLSLLSSPVFISDEMIFDSNRTVDASLMTDAFKYSFQQFSNPIYVIITLIFMIAIISTSTQKFIIPIMVLFGLISYFYFSQWITIVINIMIIYFMFRIIFQTHVINEDW